MTAVEVRDSSRMRTKSLRIASLGQLLDDARAGGAAGHAGGDHRLAERLQRARDVHALAAGHGGLLDRAVAAAEPEVRHGERLVDRGVEGDGDDHLTSRSRTRIRSAARAAASRMPSSEEQRQGDPKGRESRPALYPLRVHRDAVTSATRRTARPSTSTSRCPPACPPASGPSSSSGARHPAAHALPAPHGERRPRGAARARRARRGARSRRRASGRPRPERLARAGTASSPQRSSASVSASRAASLGSPSTTLTTRPLLRVPAAPTST